ncbi:hypothetical protein OG215_38270 (plasmid) [Streptomyces globisporus]|uniref:hypothetical protein n=1 Tax=Streptomyces globisporus TaxID=1908 RepID=UPI003863026D|nr:hypothetical protein OG215_38270 [Streptomyces globisporus]
MLELGQDVSATHHTPGAADRWRQDECAHEAYAFRAGQRDEAGGSGGDCACGDVEGQGEHGGGDQGEKP